MSVKNTKSKKLSVANFCLCTKKIAIDITNSEWAFSPSFVKNIANLFLIWASLTQNEGTSVV